MTDAYNTDDMELATAYLREGKADWWVARQVGRDSMDWARVRMRAEGREMNPITGRWTQEEFERQMLAARCRR